jgi:hypothetical protein
MSQDISMDIQQARVYGQTEIALDTTVEAVVDWLQAELGREVEEDVDYFVSAPDSDTYGNPIRVVSFSDESEIDIQVIVNA